MFAGYFGIRYKSAGYLDLQELSIRFMSARARARRDFTVPVEMPKTRCNVAVVKPFNVTKHQDGSALVRKPASARWIARKLVPSTRVPDGEKAAGP